MFGEVSFRNLIRFNPNRWSISFCDRLMWCSSVIPFLSFPFLLSFSSSLFPSLSFSFSPLTLARKEPLDFYCIFLWFFLVYVTHQNLVSISIWSLSRCCYFSCYGWFATKNVDKLEFSSLSSYFCRGKSNDKWTRYHRQNFGCSRIRPVSHFNPWLFPIIQLFDQLVQCRADFQAS